LGDVTPEARAAAARAAATRVARESYGKLVAFLAAPGRDVPGAEDALSEAFATALEVWPDRGVPENPEGWLAVAARRKMIDMARRHRGAEAISRELAMIGEELAAAVDAATPIPDRRLALMFACAHPAIDPAIRAPLMLQSILGLDAAAIASAFLVSPAAMGQRLARAKAKIRLAGVPFCVPEPAEWPERLGAALDAIYAAFARGWDEAFAEDPRGRDLTEEAIWLGRVAVALAPGEPECLGLLALMLYSGSRRAARRDATRWAVTSRSARRTRRSGTRPRSTRPRACCARRARREGRAAFSWRRRSSPPTPRAATRAVRTGPRSRASMTDCSRSRARRSSRSTGPPPSHRSTVPPKG
jgi:RNA polymerase sigma-70 factor (ECF subfamily)